MGRQGRAYPARRLDGIGELGRVGGCDGHHRDRLVAPAGPPGHDADGAVGIDQDAGLGMDLRDGFFCLLVVEPGAVEQLARAAHGALVKLEAAAFFEFRHQCGDGGAPAVQQIEHQALEIARHLDVHAGA